MGKKKVAEEPLTAEAEAPASALPENEAPRAGFPERPANSRDSITATIPLVDGKPDFSKLRPSGRERLKELFRSPEFMAEFSLGQITSEQAVPKELGETILDTFAAAEAFAFSQKFKVPYPVAYQWAKLSAEEKEKLGPVARRLIGKYMPAIAAKWADEFALAHGLVQSAVLHAQVAAMQAAQYHARVRVVQPVNGGLKEEPAAAGPVEG